MPLRIAVLASTRGTDLQAIIDAIEQKKLDVELRIVVANKECYAVERARNHGIKKRIILYKKGVDTREIYDRRLAQVLDEEGVGLIVLVGWMRLFSPWFVQKYLNRIMNIHPSLLPSFPGMDRSVHEEVLEYGCKVTGCTIHFVDEGTDTGPIIMQGTVIIDDGETVDTLKKKVQDLEMRLYPKAIQLFADRRLKIVGRKVIVME
ncbi:phosphoribosylglycinamide formyltransferase [Candidatus Woesearchaeota archaeon]|nr:phosphoribosylglycinamide formyltransferase [Candidatus Woesearchaeota archaeon]